MGGPAADTPSQAGTAVAPACGDDVRLSSGVTTRATAIPVTRVNRGTLQQLPDGRSHCFDGEHGGDFLLKELTLGSWVGKYEP